MLSLCFPSDRIFVLSLSGTYFSRRRDCPRDYAIMRWLISVKIVQKGNLQKLFSGTETLGMPSEGFGEMFKGDFADMSAEKS